MFLCLALYISMGYIGQNINSQLKISILQLSFLNNTGHETLDQAVEKLFLY